MTRKTIAAGSIILLITMLGIIVAAQKRSAELPPGVSPERWIPISENAGILLIRDIMSNRQSNVPGIQVQGILMAKSNGIWQKVYLESSEPENRFLPVR